jgi:hypothetical protein
MPSLTIVVSAYHPMADSESALGILPFRARADSLEPLATPPDGNLLRFAPSFLQSLETGPFLVVLGCLDFRPLEFPCLSSIRIFFAFATVAASAGLYVTEEPKVANKFY